MKTLLSAFVLLSSLSVSAEVIKVRLPKAGTFLVNLSAPTTCMPTEFSMATKEIGIVNYPEYFLNVETKEIRELFGRAQVCNDGFHTATGVFVVNSATDLNIDLAPGLQNSAVTVTEVAPVE